MFHKRIHRFINAIVLAGMCLHQSVYSQGFELSPVHVSRQPSFNDQIEDLAIIDLLFTERNIAWILTTGGLYRYDTVKAKKVLTFDQLDLDVDYNISQLRLLSYENKIGIHSQESMMLVDPITFETDSVFFTPSLPHDCISLESQPQIAFVEYDGPKCNVRLAGSIEEHSVYRVNQTTKLTNTELVLSTTSGLLYLNKNKVALLDTSNSHFEDNFILSASKLTDEQFLVGTYKGLYFGYKNSGFSEKQALGIPKAENITDFLANDKKNELYLLTDRALYRRDNNGLTEQISTFSSEGRVLAQHGNYLVTTFIDNKQCILSLENLKQSCNAIDNPESIEKITSVIYSTHIEGFVGTTLTGSIVRIFPSSSGQFRLESLETTPSPLSMIFEVSAEIFLIGGVNKLRLVSIMEEDNSFKTQTKASISTNGATIYDMTPMGDSFLIATSKGVYEANISKTGSEYELDIKEFFSEGSALSINSTDTHLAFTTASSLWYSDLANPTDFKQLRIRNLFPNFEFEFGISGKTPDGKLVFGGSGGLFFWDGETGVSGDSPPLLNFTGFSVNGEALDLTIAAEEITSVELSHEAYHFKADFAVMDYINPSQNRYEYKLEGFDTNWVDGKVNGSATYTNLPPGDYKLRVRGANSLGVWSDEEITLDLTVNPAWWRTWWAYTAYLCLVIWGLVLSKRHYDTVKLHLRAVLLSKEMVDASEDQMAIIEKRNSTLTRSVENQTRLLKRFMQDIELIAPA